MCSTLSIFFFNDTATTEIYTLSLHDALPICSCSIPVCRSAGTARCSRRRWPSRWCSSSSSGRGAGTRRRSEEHTSELQSRLHLVCRLLLAKKNRVIQIDEPELRAVLLLRWSA